MLRSERRTGCAERRLGGFTLLELLVVIGIIALLLAILIPVIGMVRTTARGAATRSTMVTVLGAVQQFKADQGRLPGVFSADELGSTANDTGLTQAENALLDLAGGVVTENPPPANFTVTVGSRTVTIDPLAVGGSEGPGYLSAATGIIRKADVPADQLATPSIIQDEMPDIIDAWGRPIVMWVQNELVTSTARFADIDVQSTANNGALFYWRANAPYLTTMRQGSSMLSDNVAAEQRIETLDALLGHPAFPDTTQDPRRPLQPLGPVVMHSGGADEVFLDSRSGSLRALWYGGRDEQAGDGPMPPDTVRFERSLFDDIVQAGG